jgi:hypothetical protein
VFGHEAGELRLRLRLGAPRAAIEDKGHRSSASASGGRAMRTEALQVTHFERVVTAGFGQLSASY